MHKTAVVVALLWQPWFSLQVLVQGCQLDRTDLDEFLHHIYQQLRAVESNIAQVLNQQHEQASYSKDPARSVSEGDVFHLYHQQALCKFFWHCATYTGWQPQILSWAPNVHYFSAKKKSPTNILSPSKHLWKTPVSLFLGSYWDFFKTNVFIFVVQLKIKNINRTNVSCVIWNLAPFF